MGKIRKYLYKRTLIVGDVNSGKTEQTRSILLAFIRAGYAESSAILDLAPDPVQGTGGKIKIPSGRSLLYLTAAITAPRLTGKDMEHTRDLAEQNARAIESLFAKLKRQKKEVLFVNDATLYFQAGDLTKFLKVLDTAKTQIINAYYGDTFMDSELTQREKRLTEKLIKTCDEIQYL